MNFTSAATQAAAMADTLGGTTFDGVGMGMGMGMGGDMAEEGGGPRELACQAEARLPWVAIGSAARAAVDAVEEAQGAADPAAGPGVVEVGGDPAADCLGFVATVGGQCPLCYNAMPFLNDAEDERFDGAHPEQLYGFLRELAYAQRLVLERSGLANAPVLTEQMIRIHYGAHCLRPSRALRGQLESVQRIMEHMYVTLFIQPPDGARTAHRPMLETYLKYTAMYRSLLQNYEAALAREREQRGKRRDDIPNNNNRTTPKASLLAANTFLT